MLINWEKVEIYIQPGATDMRKHINGLSAWVQEQMSRDVFSGNLYMFCSRDRKRMKIIYWDRNGFCLWQKRLEKAKYPWPGAGREVTRLEYEQLRQLLAGIDFFHAHEELKYSCAV
jgi:transposase